MAEQSISRNDRFASQPVSMQRYGHDLSYLMKRLDKMYGIIHEQQMNISRLVLLLTEKPESCAGKPPKAEMRGECRIIRFQQAKRS